VTVSAAARFSPTAGAFVPQRFSNEWAIGTLAGEPTVGAATGAMTAVFGESKQTSLPGQSKALITVIANTFAADSSVDIGPCGGPATRTNVSALSNIHRQFWVDVAADGSLCSTSAGAGVYTWFVAATQ
jgi:hypothetical protein